MDYDDAPLPFASNESGIAYAWFGPCHAGLPPVDQLPALAVTGKWPIQALVFSHLPYTR